MPRWELFTGLPDTDDSGHRPLWYWRRSDDDGTLHVGECGFPTLVECVADARKAGLTNEPLRVMREVTVGQRITARQ